MTGFGGWKKDLLGSISRCHCDGLFACLLASSLCELFRAVRDGVRFGF